MGLLGSLFGTKSGDDLIKSGTEIINKGADLLDESFYTKQEQAEMHKQLMQQALDFNKQAWADNNTARSVTRRWIAVPITIVFLLTVILLGIVYMIPPLEKSAVGLKWILETISQPFTIVLSFYFGTQGALSIIKAVKK